MKKNFDGKYIIVVITIILLLFSKNIRYFFTGEKDVIVSAPNAIYLKIPGEEYGKLYEFDNTSSKVYITVDKKYLNNDDVEAYVSGSYWNSPEKPLIKVNGRQISEIEKGNSSKTGWVFSKTYYSKNYHFYMEETIKKGKEYKFYVRIKNTSDSITIVFIGE